MQSVILLNSQWAVGFTWKKKKKDYWKALPTVCTSVHQKNLIQGKLCLEHAQRHRSASTQLVNKAPMIKFSAWTSPSSNGKRVLCLY